MKNISLNRFKKVGQVNKGKLINIKYIIIKESEIKISNFVGLCISKKKNNTILLKNNIKKETIFMLFHLSSPLISQLSLIKKYKKKYRLNKLYYK